MKWINMLRGKPVTSSKSIETQKTQPEAKFQENVNSDSEDQSQDPGFYFAGDEPATEDSVVQDLKAAQKIAQSVADKVKNTPLPRPEILKKGESGAARPQLSANKPASPGLLSKLSNQFLGKIIRIAVIIVLTLILIFVSISLFRMISSRNSDQNGDSGSTQNEVSASPTPVTYQPYEPSIYANDPEILQLEEDVSVLDAELFRASIADPVVRPPGLDFNISF